MGDHPVALGEPAEYLGLQQAIAPTDPDGPQPRPAHLDPEDDPLAAVTKQRAGGDLEHVAPFLVLQQQLFEGQRRKSFYPKALLPMPERVRPVISTRMHAIKPQWLKDLHRRLLSDVLL
jgi:hypothetical protein